MKKKICIVCFAFVWIVSLVSLAHIINDITSTDGAEDLGYISGTTRLSYVQVYDAPVAKYASIQEEIIEEPEPQYYEDTYTITAYCSCSKCCGRWNSNRPKDENGKPIVYGANNVNLISNYHIASPLPFGTIVEIDGNTYECQDRTSSKIAQRYGDRIIDIYFGNHDEAVQWGKQVKTVKIYY
ncbi:MAG: hypothetical protein EOM50_14305 [Erysipelotrichia bacterium]|nr:hypothetical protein [Erysipelotrichia bacterium]